MVTPAALGFKLHTGWATVVAVAGVPGKFDVLLRRRIELLPPGGCVPRFVYHRAAELSLSQAADLVHCAEATSQETALIEVRAVLEYLRPLVRVVKAAGITCGSRPVPEGLSAVLRSHPMIHTAEGALFQRAISSACRECGLAVVLIREREAWLKAASAWSLKEAELRKQVDDLRKSVGAPWGADQKAASAFAVLALR